MLNIYDENGQIQFDKDVEAVKRYFLDHVNPNTVFFHSLEEKLKYLVANEYYEKQFLEKYEFEFIESLYEFLYSKKFRFETFVGAYKYYTSYTLKTFDGERYLERYEDRIAIVALYLAQGNKQLALDLATEMIEGRFQPATPTFLNAGKKQRGELVSCFLIEVEDDLNSIGRSVNSALQLSKRGGGVALNLSNIRATGDPIKKNKNQASGVLPVMKILEDSFSYANQLGSRPGSGAVYLHAHHPDIVRFLDSRKEAADEKIRIKTLSLGVVIPNITFELAKRSENMYLFSPYDVERVYNMPFADVNITKEYYKMVDNAEIHKTKINARSFFQMIADVQFQSGYPYLMFEDNVNDVNSITGKIKMSNLCVEILQVQEPHLLRDDQTYEKIGKDISCNLGSLNVARTLDSRDFGKTVETAIRSLSQVSDLSNIESVPTIAAGNMKSHAVGLGAMNLHGLFAREQIHYGSPESLELTSVYFYLVQYHAIRTSMLIAKEKQQSFDGFKLSKYATGEFFDKYIERDWSPQMEKIIILFQTHFLPTQQDWLALKHDVQTYGMYNQNLQAVPPTGSISYVNNSVPSILPITAKIEIRKEGKIGRVYYPMPYMTNNNLEFYEDAYELGYEKIINVAAAAQEHIDQGISLTLFFTEDASTRDLNKAQIYAWKKNIKTLYYVRIRRNALEGTDVEGCVSCQL